MNRLDEAEHLEREVEPADTGTLAVLSKTELDQQIATAKAYPRSIKEFQERARMLVTLSERVAAECIYVLPRAGKAIEGPSARFAEVIAHSWGNCSAGARVVGEDAKFVTAQAVFRDLERNVPITFEVKRRIVDSHGRRYSPDMIAVTANAACSIALRNAILKGVPKALWVEVYEAAIRTVRGTEESLGKRREAALAEFAKLGVKREQVFAKLGVAGVEDIALDHLVVLRGIYTAINEGEITPEEAFALDQPSGGVNAIYGDCQKMMDRLRMPPAERRMLIGQFTGNLAGLFAELSKRVEQAELAAARSAQDGAAETVQEGRRAKRGKRAKSTQPQVTPQQRDSAPVTEESTGAPGAESTAVSRLLTQKEYFDLLDFAARILPPADVQPVVQSAINSFGYESWSIVPAKDLPRLTAAIREAASARYDKE
jgi:hypothetical protein